MFLTKKGLLKIIASTVIYFLLASILVLSSIILGENDALEMLVLILGIIMYFLCPIMFFLGRYSEGKAKAINLGNKLVLQELKPTEFIEYYHSLKSSNDLVVNKPSIEVLRLVATAYDLLEDKDNVFLTVDEMIDTANKNKKNYAKLLKSAFLFSFKRIEEAEIIFNETRQQKLDIMSSSLVDSILKGDRAIAMGDYKTAEVYILKQLEQTFPKLDNCSKLVYHNNLALVYENLQDIPKAITHYEYCANFGGQTAIRKKAIEKLQQLKLD